MTQSFFHRTDDWRLLCRTNLNRIKIDGCHWLHENVSNIKRQSPAGAGFSLVEVTLALGVAALCLLVLMGLLPIALKTQQTSIRQTTANQIISQIYSVLRADVRLPPGQANKVCPDPPDPNVPCNWGALHGHWLTVNQPPDTMYFTNEGKQTGNVNGDLPADAVFRAKITYIPIPPTASTSVANVVVSWPAPVDPGNGGVPLGSVTATIAVNR
jgi:type II secretory pathway pseudopilin PulG